MTAKLPVLHYSTGNGWTTLGHSTSKAGAAIVIKRVLSYENKALLERHGFVLNVGLRSDLQIELNGGPAGYTWSIGK